MDRKEAAAQVAKIRDMVRVQDVDVDVPRVSWGLFTDTHSNKARANALRCSEPKVTDAARRITKAVGDPV